MIAAVILATFGLTHPGAQAVPAGQTAFASPMVLTTRFAPIDQTLWGKGDWFTVDEYRELSKFTCDGVSLRGDFNYSTKANASGLEFAVRVREEGIVVKARVSVWNPPRNHDKSVTVILEVLVGDIPFRRATIGPLDAEEGHSPQKGEATFVFQPDLLRQASRLRLTMKTTNRQPVERLLAADRLAHVDD